MRRHRASLEPGPKQAAASALPAIPLDGAFVHAGSSLNATAWARLGHITVKAADHDRKVHAYDGVRLADVLHAAGAPVGPAVRGKAARAFVRVSASDGYAAIFTLAELDTAVPRCAPLLADAGDGMRLSATVGPVRVVAPCDRTHARWVHGVTRPTVIVNASAPAKR